MPHDRHTTTRERPPKRSKRDLRDPSLYINRELSLLAFQERVLAQVGDRSSPLLERVKFLSILSSNMAEFFMVRVGGLRQQVRAGVDDISPDGLTPSEQLEVVRERAYDILRRGREAYVLLAEELAKAGVHLLDYEDLDDEQREVADEYFRETVYPVLTPLAFDPGRPFPHISNLSLNLAVVVHDGDEERFARVKIPRSLSRLVEVCPPDGAGPVCELTHGSEPRGRSYHFVWLEQLVSAHLGTLFPGVEVVESYPFRVTRDAEVEIQELEAGDLLETIEEGVRKRRFGTVVRVTITPDMPKGIRKLLTKNLGLAPGEMIELHPPLGMTNLMHLLSIDRPDLKAPSFVPVVPASFAPLDEVDMFEAIRGGDILLHRPYDSFEPIVRLLRQAAVDPDVLAVKTTLYRVGRDSPVVEALLDAVENGREVAALVELKARFDEESNIEWARALEAQGVHVVYGLLGLKVHSKVTLIVRREGGHIRRYVHVGTGNYNVVTATQYTDLDLLTCDDAMGEDASALFNYITGYARDVDYDRFVVAPTDIRQSLEDRIRREIEHSRSGRQGRLVFKVNAVTDPAMIRLLYEASGAGVDVDLLVRGVCCLRPGIPGISENIRVRAFVGRFLEHPRIYWFDNGGTPEALIGSADLMGRNLDRRVEVLVPALDPAVRDRLAEILEVGLSHDKRTWVLDEHGVYTPLTAAASSADGRDPNQALDQQEYFLQEAGGERRTHA